MNNPRINFENVNLKTFNFTCENISFKCKAVDLKQAQAFFNQGHFYNGTRRIWATDSDVFCEEIDSEQDLEMITGK
jgi:hypothetical protein